MKFLKSLLKLSLCATLAGCIIPASFISNVQALMTSESNRIEKSQAKIVQQSVKPAVQEAVNAAIEEPVEKPVQEESKIQLLEDNLLEKLNYVTGEERALTEKSLQIVYMIKTKSVLKKLGANDRLIAGVIAVLTRESGLDPNSIETIFDEKYFIGPKKTQALSDLNGFFNNVVFPKSCNLPGFNKQGYYCQEDGKYYPGIGIAGYTGSSAKKLINYANQKGLNWYEMDAQLLFAIDPMGHMYLRAPNDEQKRNWVLNWIKENENSDITPAQAATEWNVNFEGANPDFRKSSLAEEIAPYIASLETDEVYAEEMIQLLNSQN